MDNAYDEIDGEFKVIKALGKGYTSKVLLAVHNKSKTNIAIKIYKPRKDISILEQEFENEVNTMKKVAHNNVLKIFAANNEGEYKYSNGKNTKSIIYLGVEVCNNGEFFDYIKDPEAGFNDGISRYYFHQIIEGLSAIHNAGLAHRDMKTENFFLDENFNLKIGDFGFAKFLNINTGCKMKSYLGTLGYQSPQMLESKNYNGFENDIFALGVILFVMHAGSPPFREAKMNDPWYKNFITGNIDIFWRYHSRSKTFSDSFMTLVNGLLAFTNRFTIDDIKKSEWYNEAMPTKEEVQEEMVRRRQIVKDVREKGNAQIEVDSDKSSGYSGNKSFREGDLPALELLSKTFKDMEIEEDFIHEWKGCSFDCDYIKSNIEIIKVYQDIAYWLTNKYEGIELDLNNNLLKMNIHYPNDSDNMDLDKCKIDDIHEIDMNLEVFKDKDGSVVQFFKNESMCQFDFKTLVDTIRKELIK